MEHDALLKELFGRCDDIDREWQRKGLGLEEFPELVWERTGDLDLRPLAALSSTVALLEQPEIAQHQQSSSFSDLYLRLYDNGHFWIEVLNWWGSDINIHDHDFSGVQFQLGGDALNLLYDFEEVAQVEGVALGHSQLRTTERWSPGTRSLVEPGRGSRHNVCHLGYPTTSLLIRSHPRPSWGPQWNYFPPAVASSYGIADVIFRKRVKALRLLSTADVKVFHEAFRAYVAEAPANVVLFVLIKMTDILFTPQHVGLVEEIAQREHPVYAEMVQSVASHRAAEQLKAMRWTAGLTPEERWGLAVVGSAFSAEGALAAAAATSPGEDSQHRLAQAVASARGSLRAPQRPTLDNALQALGMRGLMPVRPAEAAAP